MKYAQTSQSHISFAASSGSIAALKASKGEAPMTVFFTLIKFPFAFSVPMMKVGVLTCMALTSEMLRWTMSAKRSLETRSKGARESPVTSLCEPSV
jgi:hypothetical protein